MRPSEPRRGSQNAECIGHVWGTTATAMPPKGTMTCENEQSTTSLVISLVLSAGPILLQYRPQARVKMLDVKRAEAVLIGNLCKPRWEPPGLLLRGHLAPSGNIGIVVDPDHGGLALSRQTVTWPTMASSVGHPLWPVVVIEAGSIGVMVSTDARLNGWNFADHLDRLRAGGKRVAAARVSVRCF